MIEIHTWYLIATIVALIVCGIYIDTLLYKINKLREENRYLLRELKK